jgi:hypothetical protein
MSYLKIPVLFFVSACVISTAVSAEGVFLTKKRASHELSKIETRRIDVEFLQRFGSKNPVVSSGGANPWKAKKERKQKQKVNTASWGECRDYSLQKRNRCYKEGRQAYYCERFYEARTGKCNDDY